VQLRAEQLESQLAKSLAPVYAVHGDEPLLALEAADAVRAAARKRGFTERQVLETGRGFDWSEFAHATQSLSLFAEKKLIELRLPSGKPGSGGAEALAAGVLVDVWPVERSRLPAWISARLARQRQSASPEILEFLADRVEGNLLAAHQEVQKLALLLPPGELSLDDVQAAVSNVARYDVQGLAEALLTGDLARYVRVLEGLRGEGEAPTYVLWAVSEELRAVSRILAGISAGRQVEQLFRENRVWRNKEAAMKAALRRFSQAAVDSALSHAAVIDRVIKGIAKGNAWDEFLKLGLELKHGR